MLRIGHINFNPRSHERSDRYHSYIHFFFSSISIHAPTRGATFVVRHFAFVIAISIHAPTRGATHFETLEQRLLFISIHAPTRGATLICSILYILEGFQSTLPREERPLYVPYSIYLRDFNPRSHERSDRIFLFYQIQLIYISIHAPTRGATDLGLNTIQPFLYFNPRSHERSD